MSKKPSKFSKDRYFIKMCFKREWEIEKELKEDRVRVMSYQIKKKVRKKIIKNEVT